MQIRPWKVLNSKYILRRKWMDVREDRVELPNGIVIDEFHVLEYPDWVCVLPITEDGRVVLVEQYRHGVERICLELPAGVIEPGETPEEAGARELKEETGFVATGWRVLSQCAPEPSRHSNTAYFVVARGARRTGLPAPEESEVLRVSVEPVGSLLRLIESRRMVHGVHIAAVMTALFKGELTA